ncbi:MAG: hypothetical protein ABJK59_07450 [Erythrobacter sp.]|uniref:hypothetical protein n=1 Tax=Erythrobacter sp. TaxID=1042 RepID=UPI003297B0D7
MGRALPEDASDPGFASLGPTLLARKGGAKPAMRPQLAPLPDMAVVDDEKLEDLGWNDMGEGSEDAPAPKRPAKKAKKKTPAKKSRPAAKKAEKPTRRAAFTLRLDADRHLKLRLAATMHGISAQALVTEAIDTMFGEIEDLDALASRMKRN